MSAYEGEPTPRPWALGVRPTADQLAHWMAICTHGERVALANALLRAQDRSTECFQQDHPSEIASLRQWIANRRPLWQMPSGEQLAMIPLGGSPLVYFPED